MSSDSSNEVEQIFESFPLTSVQIGVGKYVLIRLSLKGKSKVVLRQDTEGTFHRDVAESTMELGRSKVHSLLGTDNVIIRFVTFLTTHPLFCVLLFRRVWPAKFWVGEELILMLKTRKYLSMDTRSTLAWQTMHLQRSYYLSPSLNTLLLGPMKDINRNMSILHNLLPTNS